MLMAKEEPAFPQAGRAIFTEGPHQEFPNFGPIKYPNLLETCKIYQLCILPYKDLRKNQLLNIYSDRFVITNKRF